MKISLITPAPAHSRKGNRVTADRWARLLRTLGHSVTVKEEYRREKCDVMIALHARRSFASVQRFHRQFPSLPLIVALTGTDLYNDIRSSRCAGQSLEMASRLIILQPLGAEELPKHLRHKARVIYQSAEKPTGTISHRQGVFEVGVFGHLRPVKDPFRTAMAARRLPASSRIRVLHAGGALSKAMERRARAEERLNPRYRWLGEMSHGKALRLLARCRLAVLSSKMEGGANLLSEAIVTSVPVIASHIPGSIGILGTGYAGYFPVGDTKALAALLQRAERDPQFLQTLLSSYEPLRPLFERAQERQSWKCLLEEFSEPAPADAAGPGSGPRAPEKRRTGQAETQGAHHARFTLIDCNAEHHEFDFAREVRAGLTSNPKHLSCRFFYDAEGSRLFEAICETPEYYPTRDERAILQERAGEIAGLFPKEIALVELGSGNAAKTRILMDAFLRRQRRLRYVPVDISRTTLEESSRALLAECPRLEIVAIAGEYHDGLRHLAAENNRPKLILWLGSNVGNLDRPEAVAFLRLVAEAMNAQDRLLLGIDLRKSRDVLEKAYDDAAGVTAQFNKNILVRINRELGGHFDLDTFEHRAVYNEGIGRVEMYLVSTRAQQVCIDDLRLRVAFAAGERVHTENSYKYSLAEIQALAKESRLQLKRQWLDAKRRFSANLFAAG